MTVLWQLPSGTILTMLMHSTEPRHPLQSSAVSDRLEDIQQGLLMAPLEDVCFIKDFPWFYDMLSPSEAIFCEMVSVSS